MKEFCYPEWKASVTETEYTAGRFQKQIGCIMTSLVVKECINFARENDSKLYVCFLDTKKHLTLCGMRDYLSNCPEPGIEGCNQHV